MTIYITPSSRQIAHRLAKKTKLPMKTQNVSNLSDGKLFTICLLSFLVPASAIAILTKSVEDTLSGADFFGIGWIIGFLLPFASSVALLVAAPAIGILVTLTRDRWEERHSFIRFHLLWYAAFLIAFILLILYWGLQGSLLYALLFLIPLLLLCGLSAIVATISIKIGERFVAI